MSRSRLNLWIRFFLLLFFLPAKSIYGSPVSKPDTAKKFALLIAVNNYVNLHDDLKPRGCLNDNQILKDLLTSKEKFDARNIKCLEDLHATKDSICIYLARLIQKVKEGDIVLIHFSGHGSQVFDKTAPDEPDWLDETILPCNYVHSVKDARKTSFTDKEFRIYLNELAEQKKVNLTVIIDACHSAGASNLFSISLSDDYHTTIRYIPPVLSKKDSAELAKHQASGQPQGQEKTDFPYILVAACPSEQVANEYPLTNNQYFGAMTYFLVEELYKAAPDDTWDTVIKRVQAAVKAIFPSQEVKLATKEPNKKIFSN